MTRYYGTIKPLTDLLKLSDVTITGLTALEFNGPDDLWNFLLTRPDIRRIRFTGRWMPQKPVDLGSPRLGPAVDKLVKLQWSPPAKRPGPWTVDRSCALCGPDCKHLEDY